MKLKVHVNVTIVCVSAMWTERNKTLKFQDYIDGIFIFTESQNG